MYILQPYTVVTQFANYFHCDQILKYSILVMQDSIVKLFPISYYNSQKFLQSRYMQLGIAIENQPKYLVY
jgi:hypothetical protein